jgi:(p)ppGpp synthase/HD superfamily hydrolase
MEEETMDIIVESVKLASTFHGHEYKKKSIPGIPKMGHLMEVAGIVQSNGGDEITVAAALLHDALEHQGTEARDEIREKVGPEVLSIIEGCTESETLPTWRERKEAYLKMVETASLPALLVIVADKLQNVRALLRQLRLKSAEEWWDPRREEKLWYKQSLLKAMWRRLTQLEEETDHPTPALVSLRLLIEEFAGVVAALTHYDRARTMAQDHTGNRGGVARSKRA